MAQEDFIFTDKAQYKPATVEVGFNPVKAADVTPQMEKNREIMSENFRRHQEAEEKNIERENEAQRLADDANVQRIAEFSEKLTGLIQTGIEKRVKKETAELQIWALTNKEELLKSYKQRNELEAKALTGQILANGLAADAQDKGAPSHVIKKLESLGGWRKVAVTRVLLQKAGIGYAEFRGSAEAKEITLPRIGDDGQPTGERYNIVSAQTPAESAAIVKAIQTAYVGKFVGMGTLADQHELMWSKIEEHEDSITAANGVEAEQQLNDERKRDINNQILMAANHSPKEFSKKLQELTTIHTNTYRSATAAASNFVIGFKKAIGDGQIPTEQARILLETTMLFDKSKGKEVALKDHSLYGPLLRENDIGGAIEAARGKDHEKKTLKIQNDKDDLKDEMLTTIIPELEKKNGGFLKESDILTLKLAWLKDPRGGGAGQPFPDAISNYGTVQDQDDEAARALAEHMKEVNGGYITALQASRLPAHIRKEYEDAGVIRDDLTPSKEFQNDASSKASELAKSHFKEDIGIVPTVEQGNYIRRAEAEYKKRFAYYSKLVGPDKAHDMALEWMEKNSKKFAIKPPIGSNSAYIEKTVNVGNALKLNINTNGQPDFTVKIAGLEHEINQLDKIALAGGGKLPDIFFNVTRDYKMPGGQNAAWALARAQYKAYTGKDLIAPDGVTLQGLNENERKLLNHKNTNSGTNRVIIESSKNEGSTNKDEGDKKDVSTMTQNDFLGIIEGPYKDTENSNVFYKNNDTNVTFSLADVVREKNDNSQLSNGGQYRLSASQITEGAKELGLNLDTTEFTLEVERKIFLNRLNNRLRNNNDKYSGLVKRFPALGSLNKEQTQRWNFIVDSEDNSQVVSSPFNKSDVILGALCKPSDRSRYLK